MSPGGRGARGGHAPRLLWTFLLPACLIDEDLYQQRLRELTDDDGDGWTEAKGDCDDSNPALHPTADERCNEVDDDCDGQIDEADPTNDLGWTADADSDGFGADTATIQRACASPGPGWVSAQGDCDDFDPAVWPGAPEACDGVDNDCDGATDEEPTVDPPEWHPDADGDGFGALGPGTTQCLSPAGAQVQEGTDCDDTDAAVHPEAEERCNGLDDDCDGEADEPPIASGAGWYPDTDGDGYGDDQAGSCTASDGYVEQDGDCDDENPDVHPSAEERCNDGLDDDCNGSPDDCVWAETIDMTDQIRILSNHAEDDLGYSGDFGDLDGDGTTDLVIGAEWAWSDSDSEVRGAVYVMGAPFSTTVSAEDADWAIRGKQTEEAVGTSVVVEDLDGDGYHDLVSGAAGWDDGSESLAGALYTLYGPLTSGGYVNDRADWSIYGSASWDLVGWRANRVGDLDGDGLPDVATSYEDYSTATNDWVGVVWLLTQAGSGEQSIDDAATATIYGSNYNDQVGLDTTGIDLDGDGQDDLATGAMGYEHGSTDGAALVFFGPVTGELGTDDADLLFYAEGSVDYAGRKLANLGDISGDGLEDLLVGAPYAEDGAAYILWGDAAITSRGLGDADITFRETRSNRYLGYSVDALDDLNDDGWPDLFLSEAYYGEACNGYVFFGPFSATSTFQSSEADVTLTGDSGTDAVYEVAFNPGDVTDDGVNDLVVGSYKYGDDWSGIVYIIPGVGY